MELDLTIPRPAIRYHGSKFRLAPWIVGFFPEHVTYVEPFGGGAGILLRKPVVNTEIYNDLDSDVVNFFSVLRTQRRLAPRRNPHPRQTVSLARSPAPNTSG